MSNPTDSKELYRSAARSQGEYMLETSNLLSTTFLPPSLSLFEEKEKTKVINSTNGVPSPENLLRIIECKTLLETYREVILYTDRFERKCSILKESYPDLKYYSYISKIICYSDGLPSKIKLCLY